MIVGVADTHAIIWYLSKDARISPSAKLFIDNAYNAGDQIAFSAISFIEMVYLVEKGRIPAQHFTHLASIIHEPDNLFKELPVDLHIARALSRVDVNQIPDMPDRIVAATALHLNVPIISRDGKIRLSGLNTIW